MKAKVWLKTESEPYIGEVVKTINDLFLVFKGGKAQSYGNNIWWMFPIGNIAKIIVEGEPDAIARI